MLTATLGAALVLTLTACGGAKSPEGSDPDGSGAETPRLGAIDLLFQDMYGDYNEDQGAADQMRSEELIAQCMGEQGFEYTPVDYGAMNSGGVISTDELDVQWGTLEFAKEWGYGITTNPYGDQMEEPVDSGEQWVDPNQAYVEAMSATEQEAYYLALYGAQYNQEYVEGQEYEWKWEDAGCQGFAQHEVYPDSMGDQDSEYAALMDEMNTMWESSMSDPRMAEIETDWASCMSDAGYAGLAKVDDAQAQIYAKVEPIWNDAYADMPPDATEEDYAAVQEEVDAQLAAITAEEIETAVADFTCRDDVKYTETQTDINLEYQQEFYDAHKAELEAWVASMDASGAKG
jgi:hypothetical protein